MRNYLFVSVAALVCVGCASDRLDHSRVSTTSTRFSIANDPILRAAPPQGDKKTITGEPKEKEQNIHELLKRYYITSHYARNLEYEQAGDQLKPKYMVPIPASEYANALIDYRAAGFSASRGICEYALSLLGESHSDYRFANKSLSLASGGVSSLMGVFKASARSVSIYATGSALFQAWSQDFEEYAFLTASIGTISEKVKSAQDTYARGVQGGGDQAKDDLRGKYEVVPPRDWATATLQIQQYNNFCLATGMRSLVEKAVGKSEVYFDSKSGTVEFFSAQNLQELKFALQQKERATLEQALHDEYARVERATAALSLGKQKAANAKVVIAKPKGNFYVAADHTVDLAASEAAVRQAKAAAIAAGVAFDTDPGYIKAVQEDTAARELDQALKDSAAYDSAWEKAADQKLTEAIGQREAVSKKLRELPTGLSS